LDEAFVAEYGKPDVKFIIRGSPWKILHLYGDKIYVKSVDDPTGAIPSWVGEEIPVPFEVAQEVGRIRGFVEQQMKKGKTADEVASQLATKYPAKEDVVRRALRETFEQVREGYPVPTDMRITVEDWEDLVVMHVGFGSLTNRAFAQLLGHYLSERTGYTVAVQHDPYRIFIQSMGTTKADGVVSLIEELEHASDDSLRETLTRATVKTGLFKRRMIHVARRFGALKKWADFSTMSLKQLLKSFEETAIYEEALKEAFTKDLDLEGLLRVIGELRRNEVTIAKVDTRGRMTPVARVGIERASMKTDLIPPERMRLILVESARVRLLNEVRSFVCTNCWDYLEMMHIKDLPDKPTCPRCGSPALGLLRKEEDAVRSLVEKKGEKLTKEEARLQEQACKTAELISIYGKPAAAALAARRAKPENMRGVFKKERALNDHFFELVLDAERKALQQRFFAD
jgi:ATP-dependent Lhr-like helicase